MVPLMTNATRYLFQLRDKTCNQYTRLAPFPPRGPAAKISRSITRITQQRHRDYSTLNKVLTRIRASCLIFKYAIFSLKYQVKDCFVLRTAWVGALTAINSSKEYA